MTGHGAQGAPVRRQIRRARVVTAGRPADHLTAASARRQERSLERGDAAVADVLIRVRRPDHPRARSRPRRRPELAPRPQRWLVAAAAGPRRPRGAGGAGRCAAGGRPRPRRRRREAYRRSWASRSMPDRRVGGRRRPGTPARPMTPSRSWSTWPVRWRGRGCIGLRAGDRVGDAIEAAGGFAPRVDLAAASQTLNLAQPLEDGAKVLVPELGIDRPGEAAPDDGRIDLNRAGQAELESLPGVGPVTARKIDRGTLRAPLRRRARPAQPRPREASRCSTSSRTSCGPARRNEAPVSRLPRARLAGRRRHRRGAALADGGPFALPLPPWLRPRWG